MAGTTEFHTKRQKTRYDIKNAQEFHDNALIEQQALAECPSEFQERLTRLTDANDKLATTAATCLKLLTNVEGACADIIEKLQKDNERYDFAARHGDFVSRFEERVFQRMRLLPKYQEALAAGAAPLKNKQEALELLWELANAEEDWDEDVQAGALTQGNLLMRDAWNESITAKGLALEEYAELRIFKDDTNRCFHQSGSAAQALAELKTSLPLPDPYARFKPTLVKLLEVLSGPQKGAAR